MVDRGSISMQLRDLGLHQGEAVILHSSFKSMGDVSGGADAVIDAFGDVLGENGTLMVPAYTYSYAGNINAPPFGPDIPPSKTNGIIPLTLCQRKEAKRSTHPTYSCAAIGGNAQLLIDGHPDSSPLGLLSPLGKLAAFGGKVVLLGVGNTANSMIHTGETLAGAPYLCIPFRASWGTCARRISKDGMVELVPQTQFPGCSLGFGKLDSILEENRLVTFGCIGNARVMVIPAAELCEIVAKRINRDFEFLFCDREECECCTRRRQFLRTGK